MRIILGPNIVHDVGGGLLLALYYVAAGIVRDGGADVAELLLHRGQVRVVLTRVGFVLTSCTLETSMPGLFAARDVRVGSMHQAASAAGEGATAALMIREYLHTIG